MQSVWMGNDCTGYDAKKAAMVALERMRYWVVNEGRDDREPEDWLTAAGKVAEAVAAGRCACAFWFGQSAPAVCALANRRAGVRAAVAATPAEARAAREAFGANLLCIVTAGRQDNARAAALAAAFCQTEPGDAIGAVAAFRDADAALPCPATPPRPDAPLLLPPGFGTPGPEGPVSILLDTDMLTDCDDVAALALLLELERAGLAHILGVAVSSACPASAAAVSAVNTFYGRSDIPVGAPKNGTGFRRDDSCFLDALAREFPHPVADNDDAEDAVRLMRRLLAAAPDRSVKLVTIGYLSNLDGLLRSGPDECSPLAGPALCAAKIREWVCMTGNFPDDPAIDNVNFTRDAPAALRAVRAWPGTVTFVGRDIGHNIFVGDRFHDLPEPHPLRRAYQLHRGRFGENWDHHTADPSTILYAVCGLGPWFARQGGRLYLRDDCSFTWEPGPVGRMSYLLQVADRTETARVIDALTRPCHAPATAVPQPSPCTRPAGR